MAARSDPALDAILEDFLTRRENSDPPTPQEYLARHPEFAAELGRFFDDLEFVDTRLVADRPTFPTFDATEEKARDEAELDEVAGSSAQLPAVGRFKVLEELGSGSQGVVYKAEQLGTKRLVALKIIREGAFASSVERRRFENEVQLASQLKHPNIVAIFECGRDKGRDYFAMEYVEGVPLDVYLNSRTLSIPETIGILLQVCDGVNYAHQRGVIHRDLKPTNIIVDPQGRAHILDFGLARRIADDDSAPIPRMTQVGMFAGTWHYASPEQVRHDSDLLDVRSDVYALGVIFYEGLTDAYPYPIEGESRAKIAEHILETIPNPPSSIRGDIDDDVDTIVLRALQKDPDRRYQSAAAFGEDLNRYLAGEAIEAKRDSHWYILRMTLRRYRWRVTAALAGIVILMAFAVMVTILYAEATAARATTEVRSELVRSSQRYLVEKLGDLHRLSNAVREVREKDRSLPAVVRLEKPLRPTPGQLLLEATRDVPDNIDQTMRLGGGATFAAGAAWLRANRSLLEEMRQAAEGSRFDFSAEGGARQRDWIISGFPMYVGEAERASQVLVASALLDFHEGNDDSAIRSFGAARSIALDLGDGRTVFPIDSSIAARMRGYEALSYVLEVSVDQQNRAEGYIEFVLADPPLPGYRDAVITERLKLAQLFEGAARAGRLGQTQYLDLDSLERVFPGFRGPAKLSDVEAIDVSVDELNSAMERFAFEAESWEDLPIPEVLSRHSSLLRDLGEKPATKVLTSLLTDLRPGLIQRARAGAMRSATQLAAYVCRYRLQAGAWPDGLADAVPPNASKVALDPYSGVELGYRIVNGEPVLYSLNEDGVDDQGSAGTWGQPMTDVILFPINR